MNLIHRSRDVRQHSLPVHRFSSRELEKVSDADIGFKGPGRRRPTVKPPVHHALEYFDSTGLRKTWPRH